MNKHIGSNFDDFMNQEKFIEWLREVLEINANVDWSMVNAEDEFKLILDELNKMTKNKEVMDDHDAGVIAGMKLAYELVGKLAHCYGNDIGIDKTASDEERAAHERICKAQESACKYAQHVIQVGEWKDEEELPW
jgi:hypothetical protein